MVKKKLEEIFKKSFPGITKVEESTSSADIREWDSLRHVMLIAEVEKTFNISFEITDMLQMKTFGEICKKVEEKIS